MPVTIHPAPHGASQFKTNPYYTPASSSLDLLTSTARSELAKVKNVQLIQSSFTDLTSESKIYPVKNGLVNTCITAYNQHHHLTIRPDDVWLAILGQLNIFINTHAEELRHFFVSYEGKKKLVIVESGCDPKGDPKFGVDWGQFSYKMSKLLGENVKDAELAKWVLPEYTTTTKVDQAVASVMFMATLQSYFSFGCRIRCGLPSVTLAGQKEDWEKILEKADKLGMFGKECEAWLSVLRPVLLRFVGSFDEAKSEECLDFWQRIVHYFGGGSGPTWLSGWITAFCFFRDDGATFHIAKDIPTPESQTYRGTTPVLELDGIRYHRLETTEIPSGWAGVPVEIDNMGTIYEAVMVAGGVGMKVSCSGTPLEDGKVEELDSVAAESGWWIYEKIDLGPGETPAGGSRWR